MGRRQGWSNLCPSKSFRKLDLTLAVLRRKAQSSEGTTGPQTNISTYRFNCWRAAWESAGCELFALLTLRPSNCQMSDDLRRNIHCGFMRELGADWFTVRAGRGKLFLCFGGLGQRKGKKVTEFFPPRDGVAPFQHFLHGQTPFFEGTNKDGSSTPIPLRRD